MKAIRSFITQKVDAIILAPQIETGWEPVLKEAKEAHIPVFLVDRGIQTADESLYVTKIASDFIEEGRRAAAWLAEKTGGKANIVELQGTTGAAPAIDRQKGFAEELKKHEGMKIVKTQSANFERAKGKEVMQALLKADPQHTINAVYAHNDDMALGAIQAIEEAGLKPGKDIILISIDGIHDAFQSMADGKLSASVECNPLLGPAVFDAIDKHRAGQTLPKWIKQQDNLFDQSTAAEALKSRQY
jgi:ABC-type sugar transport system substrate-binding protein